MNDDSQAPASAHELPPPLEPEPQPPATANTSNPGWPALTTVMRWLGAITLLSSALTYLVSEWNETEQILRYGYFLGFTMLLSGCGWFCISKWKDDKGARTFFALGAALVPAHFAQLGAMLFANREAEMQFDGIRQAFSFTPSSGPVLIGTFGVALAALIPLTYVGFAAMARKQALKLTTVYLLANATLLFTVRDPSLVALIGFGLLGGLIWADQRYFATQSRMQTWDGLAMRTLLFAPFALLVGRNLVLHGADSFLIYSLLFCALTTALYLGLPRCLKYDGLRWTSRLISLAPAFAAWFCLVASLGAKSADWVTLMLLPCCVIAGLLSFKMGPFKQTVRSLAAGAAVSGALWQLITVESVGSSLLAVATSLAAILVGYSIRERWVFRFGLIGMGLGLVYHLRYAAELYQGPWLWASLAVTGVAVLLASSYLERYGRQGIQAVKTLHHKVSGWR